MENKNTEKYRIFFRDLIVLARETMVAHKNNIEPKPHYFLTRLNNPKIWYQINYDVTLKKWLILKHDNKNEPVIFNPKVISGIQKFLDFANPIKIIIVSTIFYFYVLSNKKTM